MRSAFERRRWVNGARRGYKRTKSVTSICLRCNKKFIKNGSYQLYCGSFTNKLGCSFERERERWRRLEAEYRKTKPKWWLKARKKSKENFNKKHPNYQKEYRLKHRLTPITIN